MKKAPMLLFVILFICISITAWAEEPIKIGVVMNLTGPWASIDGPATRGIQLAAEQVNEEGGILGRPIELVVVDTKADQAEVVAATIRLIESENVVALIGYCDTHWVNIAAPLAREYDIPFITPGATHPRMPERNSAWLISFGDNAQAAVVAEYAVHDLGLTRGVIWIDTACDFCVAVSAYFADVLENLGGEVVYEDYFETTWTDFSGMVARLKGFQDQGQVDFVYPSAIPGNAGLIVRQLREGGVTIPIFSADGLDTPLLVEVGGEHAEGVVFASHISLEDPDPKIQQWVADYEEMFGFPPETSFASVGTDSILVLKEAIETIGEVDPARIPEGLGMIDGFEGISGVYSYTDGTQVPTKTVSVIEVQDGIFVTLRQVYPDPETLPDPTVAN